MSSFKDIKKEEEKITKFEPIIEKEKKVVDDVSDEEILEEHKAKLNEEAKRDGKRILRRKEKKMILNKEYDSTQSKEMIIIGLAAVGVMFLFIL